MSSNMKKIVRAATDTFSTPTCLSQFQKNLGRLVQKVNRLTLSDVYPKNASIAELEAYGYVHIHKDPQMSIGMFILKPSDPILTLHDHPLMYGILKVLSGSVHIQSYTAQNTRNCCIEEKSAFEVCRPSERYFLRRPYSYATDKSFVVRKNSPIVSNVTDHCCLLTPMDSNFHEIRYLSGESARFFDILSPPYATVANKLGPRDCTIFKEVRSWRDKEEYAELAARGAMHS